MELRTLRYFLAAAQEENITRAADILHVTQPTLSRQIMDLERELGVTLMLRGKNGLTLTDDGVFFRQRAQEVVELADRLENILLCSLPSTMRRWTTSKAGWTRGWWTSACCWNPSM